MYLYTDGSSSIKDGDGAWAFVLVVDKSTTILKSGYMPTATNNRAELTAVIMGLKEIETAKLSRSPIMVVSDSTYVIGGIDKFFKEGLARNLPNGDLWAELASLLDDSVVTTEKVKGHSGHEYNELCDMLCGLALSKKFGQTTYDVPGVLRTP